MKLLRLIAIAIFMVFSGSAFSNTVLPYELDVIDAINQVRTDNGTHALAFDNILFDAARIHAADMAVNGALSYELSDGTPWHQTPRDLGYVGTGIAAQAAGGYGALEGRGANELVAEMMSYTVSKDNILNISYNGIGVGYVDRYTFIYFGSAVPAPSAVPVPAAAWLFASGLLGLAAVARRKKV